MGSNSSTVDPEYDKKSNSTKGEETTSGREKNQSLLDILLPKSYFYLCHSITFADCLETPFNNSYVLM